MPRWMEVLLAVCGLLCLAVPMGLIALAILVSSGRPVLFHQTRVGRSGIPFRIVKFRTMVRESERTGGKLTLGGCDPRVTALGSVLRRFKLDELPQLWNVVRGEMSFVGPRPEVPEYVALWNDATREQVLSVLPGITDVASIAFRRESEILARAEDPERFYVERILPRKLRLNARYLESRSAARDLGVIATTVRRAVIRG